MSSRQRFLPILFTNVFQALKANVKHTVGIYNIFTGMNKKYKKPVILKHAQTFYVIFIFMAQFL